MPYLNLPQVPLPRDLSSQKGTAEYVKLLYDTLCKWRQMLTTTELTGGSGYITISTVAPTSTDGQENDIWVKR